MQEYLACVSHVLCVRELLYTFVTAHQLSIRIRTLRSDRHIAHYGVTMAQVATDPAIAKTVIGDSEEDESKVRGVRPLAHSSLQQHRCLTTLPFPGSSHETARRRNGTRG
jgi:hypothetical protein